MIKVQGNPVKEPENPTPWDIAYKALELISQFGCQPGPKAYEVFFAYAAGQASVRSQVEKASLSDQILTSFDLDKIHHDNFRTGDGEWQRQQRCSNVIESSLSEALDAIDGHAKAGKIYESRLQIATDKLVAGSPSDNLPEVLKGLIKDTGAVQDATATIKTTLLETRNLVTGIKSELGSARHESGKDLLTGLLGRRGFDVQLENEVSKAMKNGVQLIVCLMAVDDFAAVNEKHDRGVGDAVIRSIGKIVGRFAANGEIVARVGGLKFVLVMQGCSIREALTTAEAIRKDLETRAFVPRGTDSTVGPLTGSFGLSVLRTGDQGADLFARAAEHVAMAKTKKGNTVEYDRSELI